MKKFFTRSILSIVLFSAIGIMDGNAAANDASIISITAPTICSPALSFKLGNPGSNLLKPVKIGWSVNGTYQAANTYSQGLGSGGNVTIVLTPDYNFISGQSYSVKVFSYAPNNTTDGNLANDTAKLTFTYISHRPFGAAFIKGTPFESPNPNTTGTQTDPDIVAKGNKLSYELTPPTGYTNANYGSTWTALSVVVMSSKGYVLNTKYWTYSAPSGSTPAKFTFSPDAALVDTCLRFILKIKDVGPYFCDSTISRYICVTPRPVPNFKVNGPACDSDTIIFTNTSNISSGIFSSKWNFGTGNPADIANTKDAKFKFPASGTYFVKLTTTSSTNITDSISIPIVVNASPDGGFTYTITGNTVNFKAKQTGVVTYQWNFGDGGKAQTINPQHQYASTPSNYSVCLSVISNDQCDAESCQTISITGGVSAIDKKRGLSVYPNPNTGSFTVTVDNPKSDVSISVYNILGEEIKNIETKPLASGYSLDMDVPNGIYMVKVNNGGLVSSQRIAVNKH